MAAMATSLEVVIPCLNEVAALPVGVRRLHAYMGEALAGYEWGIVIADNGSTDGTLAQAAALSAEFPEVRYIRLEERGRGRALRRAWTESGADIVAYMDVDLATDLAHLPELAAAVASGEWDIAIGSRLLPGSRVVGRSLKREITSRGYSLLFRALFLTTFRDAQ